MKDGYNRETIITKSPYTQIIALLKNAKKPMRLEMIMPHIYPDACKKDADAKTYRSAYRNLYNKMNILMRDTIHLVIKKSWEDGRGSTPTTYYTSEGRAELYKKKGWWLD